MYRTFIEHTLSQAKDIALGYFGTVSTTVKVDDNNQVLTEADIAIGEMIVASITSQFPDHNIIDEEAGVIDKGSATTWVVDPIDGTSNFAAGLPMYGCMIGVLDNDRPVAGGVVLPSFNQLYIAEKGLGATCNGKAIAISPVQSLSDALIAYGIDGHQDDPERTRHEARLMGDIVLAIRNLRSTNSAYDMMMVAQGAYGLTLNQTTKIWDNVGPQIIFEEAGGTVTDFYGRPMDYSHALLRSEDNFTICAGSPNLHAAMQRIIHEKSSAS